MQRTNRDTELQHLNRAWAKEAQLCPPLLPAIHFQTRSELPVSN